MESKHIYFNKTISRNFFLEEVKGIETLNAQYKKELKNAYDGTGLCKGMSKISRQTIVNRLKKHISDNENYIKEMLAYIKENE